LTKAGRRERSSSGGQFDSALGWRSGFRLSNVVRFVLCGLAFLVFVVPFITIFVGAIDGSNNSTTLSLWPTDPTLNAIGTATSKGVWGYFANSHFIAVGGLALQIAIAVLSSYALARHRFRGQAFV